MNLKKELLGLVCLVLALILFCSLAVGVLIPRRYDYGATWDMYLKEPKNSVEVMFFGSSLVYCDFVPSVIYEETGVASYVMAGPDQRIPMSYYYLQEACKTQSPKVVFVEATPMLLTGESLSTKINLTYMPYNLNRLLPTFSEAEEKDLFGLLFPVGAYHDRWDKLTPEDWEKGLQGYEPDLLAGYTFLSQATDLTGKSPVREYDNVYENNLKYARKMVEFCKSRQIELVFFLAPRVTQPTREMQERLEKELTALGVPFLNDNEALDQMGLDYSVDFFDDMHFNYRGAEKYSRFFAQRLAEMDLPAAGDDTASLWQQRIDQFAEMKDVWEKRPIQYRPAAPGEDAA